MTRVSPWYDRHGWLGVDNPQQLLQCSLSDLICLCFDYWPNPWFDDLCFALLWPSRLTGRSLSTVTKRWLPQWGISQLAHLWLDDLPWYDLLGYQLVKKKKKKSLPTKLSTDVRARSCQLWAVRVCTETKLDEACRWLPRPEHAESREQRKPSPSHDSRHLPSLSGALDVSGAEL